MATRRQRDAAIGRYRGQGDNETRRKKDKETWGQGDIETRRREAYQALQGGLSE